jgi:hypothetical protein
MPRRALVVDYGISVVLGEVVVGVTVLCPNGCTEGRRGTLRPRRHSHGWTRTHGSDGGDRAAHCAAAGATGYRLHWPGGVPADVTEALEARYARSA